MVRSPISRYAARVCFPVGPPEGIYMPNSEKDPSLKLREEKQKMSEVRDKKTWRKPVLTFIRIKQTWVGNQSTTGP
jgi:hypothetical protein